MYQQIYNMRIVALILIIGFFTSCNSKSYRAIAAVDKGFKIDSVAAEKRAKQIAPCVTVSQDTLVQNTTNTVYDTTDVIQDTTIILPCPDGTTVSTKLKIVTYTIRANTVVTKTFFITKTIEDKGKDIVIRDLQNKVVKMQHKRDFWLYSSIIATLLFLLSVIILLIKKSLKL